MLEVFPSMKAAATMRGKEKANLNRKLYQKIGEETKLVRMHDLILFLHFQNS